MEIKNMALFGNKNKENVNDVDLQEKIEEERKQKIKEDFQKLVDEETNAKGIIVHMQGDQFANRKICKFSVENGNYVFRRHYEKVTYYWEKDYEKLLAEKPVCVSENDFDCSPVQDEIIWEPSKECIGEVETKIPTMKLRFSLKANPNEFFLAIIENTKQDFSVLGECAEKIKQNELSNISNVSAESFSVDVENSVGFFQKSRYQMIRNGNAIDFVRKDLRYSTNKICKVSILVDEILYYKSEGMLRYEQQLSGGGGMGINYGGAVIGGLLFGEAGAMIGSRKNEQIQNIESKTVTHDTRILTLAIKRNNAVYQVGFSIGSEMAFDWLIPEKQYDYVIQKRREYYENNSL